VTQTEKNLEQSLLLLQVEPVGDLLGDQGGIAAGAVVDNEAHLVLSFMASKIYLAKLI
jgi:hypothetical protein